MASLIMGLLAETSIHPGAGRTLGAIDLPVAREAATDYPVIVGSSLKGALRDVARDRKADHDKLFGKQIEAGQILVSDARLLLLPVRSLTGQYRWVTCPHVLERLSRDRQRAGLAASSTVGDVKQFEALASGNTTLFLEEREFKVTAEVPATAIAEISDLISDNQVKARLASQLVVLSNDDFGWFARYGLAVQARNVLDENSKVSKNLWYEETLPPDSLMYALIAERRSGTIDLFRDLFKVQRYLQAGGNETIGQGVFSVELLPKTVAKGEVAS